MNLLALRRSRPSHHSGRAGRSAVRCFHDQRIKNLRREWKLWLAFAGLAALAVVFMVRFGRIGLGVGGWILGFITAFCLFGWMIGFDVRALPLLWGSWGEEDTGLELTRLGARWYVRHDIPNKYGNWDHVAVGPPGVFMIDSKRLRGKISVGDDGLSSGRIRFNGKTFRGAALGLRRALSAEADGCPIVQAVIAVWGDFPAKPYEENRVVYTNASGLADWLESRPAVIDDDRRVALTAALQRL